MKTLTLAALAAALPLAALAGPITVTDPYARSANPETGAAFMVIHNVGDTDCTLTGAASDAAGKVELHTHKDEGGVMKMMAVESMTIPAKGEHTLMRGGDHVMFFGLKTPFTDGTVVPVTLDFGACGTVAVEAKVDNARKPDAAGMGQMKGHGHDHSKMNKP